MSYGESETPKNRPALTRGRRMVALGMCTLLATTGMAGSLFLAGSTAQAVAPSAATVSTGSVFSNVVTRDAGDVYAPADEVKVPTTAEEESAVYNEWHFDPSMSHEVKSQERNGFVAAGDGTSLLLMKGNGADTVDPSDTTLRDQIADLADSLKLITSSTSENVTFQIPIYFGYENGAWSFTTLRKAVGSTEDAWTTSAAIGTIEAGETLPIGAIINALPEDARAIGAGFLIYKPTGDVLVSSFTANGDTTKFYAEPTAATAGDAASEFVDSDTIRPNEDTYVGWHEGVAGSSAVRETVLNDDESALGLKVTGESQILNGFTDGAFLPGGLALGAGFKIVVEEGSDVVYAQLPIFYYVDGVAGRQFTTLRAQVPASGDLSEATSWTTSKAIKDAAGETLVDANGSRDSLSDFAALIPNHDVIGYGVFNEGTSMIRSISFNNQVTEFFQVSQAVIDARTAAFEAVDTAAVAAKKAINDLENLAEDATEKSDAIAAIEAAVTAANSQIAEANTVAAVTTAKTTATDAIDTAVAEAEAADAAAADAKTLAEAKAAAVAALEEKAASVMNDLEALPGASEDDIEAAKIAAIDALAAAKDEVADATTTAGVKTALEDGLGGLQGVYDTLAEQNEANLAEAKEVADAALDADAVTAKAAIDALPELDAEGKTAAKGTVDAAVTAGKEAIAGATTVADVTIAKEAALGNTAKAVADAVTADAKVVTDAKTAAEKELAAKAATVKGQIDGLKGASAAEKKAAKAKIDAALAVAKTTVGSATSTASVKTSVAAGKAAMDQIFKDANPVIEPCVVPSKAPVFLDTPVSHKFYKEIDWMYCMKYTTGNKAPGGLNYAPQEELSRQAMAAFIYRLEAPKGYVAPKVSPFADVAPGDKFYKEITWMHAKGLSTGTRQASGKPMFMPKDSLSREAMAAFIYRLEAPKNYTAPKMSKLADMKPGMSFYKEISWMYDVKLTTGNKTAAGKEYLPKDKLSRQAMAAFIYRLVTDYRK